MRHDRATTLGWGALLAAVLVGGASAAPGELLAQAIDTQEKANAEGVEAQKRIDELADRTDELLTQYRNALKQIESLRVYNSQTEELIAAQREEMASLQEQIDQVEVVGRGVTPLMFKMIDALDQFVELDVPFLMEERRKRIAALREMMNQSDVTDSEKFRRILEAYQIENEFGRTIEAYRSTLQRDGKELMVDFLRVGRIALVYQTLDGTENGVWDAQERGWRQLDSSYRSAIQQGLRVARKQTAPDMIRLPLPAAESAGGRT
jgi:septal ring factor EnvC (AmiA/AmiB activator)